MLRRLPCVSLRFSAPPSSCRLLPRQLHTPLSPPLISSSFPSSSLLLSTIRFNGSDNGSNDKPNSFSQEQEVPSQPSSPEKSSSTPPPPSSGPSARQTRAQHQRQPPSPGLASGFANASSSSSLSSSSSRFRSAAGRRSSSSSSSSSLAAAASSKKAAAAAIRKLAQQQQQQHRHPQRRGSGGGVGGGVAASSAATRGHLRSRSPSATPMAMRQATAHLRAIREARVRMAKARKEKQLQQQILKNKPNMETGERVPGLWGIWLRFLHTRPITAVVVSSFVLWSAGDITAQYLEHRLHSEDVDEAVSQVEHDLDSDYSSSGGGGGGKNSDGAGGGSSGGSGSSFGKFNWARYFGSVLDGVVMVGIGSYFWYRALDNFVTGVCMLRSGTFAFVATKIFIESTVYHPCQLTSYWWITSTFCGDSPSEIWRELKTDFVPTLIGEWALWMPIDTLFFYKVPVHLQVIICNVACFFESIALSYIRSRGIGSLFPAAPPDSLEDRGMPISVVDVVRQTDVSFEWALRDGASRFGGCLDPDGRGFFTAEDLERFLGADFEKNDYEIADRDHEPLPGLPSLRATEVCGELLLRHARHKGAQGITRTEYLRFIGELHRNAYRESMLPNVAFTLFDSSKRHMISGEDLIKLALLLQDDTPAGRETVQLMLPVLGALKDKELSVAEATEVLHAMETLARLAAVSSGSSSGR